MDVRISIFDPWVEPTYEAKVRSLISQLPLSSDSSDFRRLLDSDSLQIRFVSSMGFGVAGTIRDSIDGRPLLQMVFLDSLFQGGTTDRDLLAIMSHELEHVRQSIATPDNISFDRWRLIDTPPIWGMDIQRFEHEYAAYLKQIGTQIYLNCWHGDGYAVTFRRGGPIALRRFIQKQYRFFEQYPARKAELDSIATHPPRR